MPIGARIAEIYKYRLLAALFYGPALDFADW
jgi:hypothetical protein